MKKDKTTLAFIMGILSIILFIPIIEGFVEIIVNWFEAFKIKPMMKTLNGNKKIQDIQAEQEPISTQCMGFQYNNEEEFDEDFEDNKKTKIGFHI